MSQKFLKLYLNYRGKYLYIRDIEKNKELFIRAYEWGKKREKRHFKNLFEKNHVFLSLTDTCSLNCKHCALNTSTKVNKIDMPYDTVISLINEIFNAQYKILALSGAEPFMYKYFIPLIKYLKNIRHLSTKIWLYTNMQMDIDNEIILDITDTFDKIIISIDGCEEEHDARRGYGSFKKATNNIKKITINQRKSEIAIRATLTSEQVKNGVENEIISIAKDVKIKQVLFSKLLPIGRAKENYINIEKFNEQKIDPDFFNKNFIPRNNCGIGSNIQISPNGDIFPCWAMIENNYKIGNIKDGFKNILKNYKKRRFFYNNVDNIDKCNSCDVRYICGGVCYAFVNRDCSNIYKQIIKYLEIAKNNI